MPARLSAALLLTSALAALGARAGVDEGLTAYARGDFAAALQELTPAANGGNANAQFMLGMMYLDGRGVAQDDAAAARWLRRAADQGHPSAQGRLGQMLAIGRGVPQHEGDAVAWWRRGADQGDPDSQGLLGMAYAEGSGVARDPQQAYFWLLLATAHASGDAFVRYQRTRDRVERGLTAEQRRAGQDAARDWRPRPALSFALPAAPQAAPAPRPFGRLSSGSGFVVAPGRVVTNHHVVNGCERLRVGGRDVAGVLADDRTVDLALLDAGDGAAAALRTVPPSVGEPAIVVGYPLSGLLGGFNITTGNVSGLGGVRGDPRLLQITAPVQPGNSGGPLLDSAGNVMGVVVAKLDALRVAQRTGDVPQNVNFAISAGVLAKFLDAQGVRYTQAAAGGMQAVQDVARRAQGFTVLVECWR